MKQSITKKYTTIGVMSGSSVDGLDIACVEFLYKNKQWNFDVIASKCFSISAKLKQQLFAATTLNAYEFELLNVVYGKFIAQKINAFINQFNINKKGLIIACHGHTTFHEPQKGISVQMGCGATIAANTNTTTITHLRSIDVAFGGQGAPIVPIAELHLFKQHNLFLNIGGIANITFINQQKESIAFDICAANSVLNFYANKLNKPFDKNGNIARKGSIDIHLLNELNQLSYYKKPFPKSLANSFGRETVITIIECYNLDVASVLATYTEHIALQISASINKINQPQKNVLVTGGGAFNNYLIDRIKHHSKAIITIPDKEIVCYKEAIAIAFIGVLRINNLPNVWASVTGAKRNSSNGCVWLA